MDKILKDYRRVGNQGRNKGRKVESQKNKKLKTCWCCGKEGHLARNCENKSPQDHQGPKDKGWEQIKTKINQIKLQWELDKWVNWGHEGIRIDRHRPEQWQF